jgi:DNA-binding beta-propeller fold protein YncE
MRHLRRRGHLLALVILIVAASWIGSGLRVAVAQEGGGGRRPQVLPGDVAGAQAYPKDAANGRPTIVIDRAPVRIVEDNHPTFNAIAMDVERGEVFIANSNEASNTGIFVYPTQFQPTDKILEPRRVISGPKADLGQTCGVAVSPEFKEIYAVEGDGGDMKVFPMDGNGDVGPSRTLAVAHGSGGIFLDAKNDELFITTEHVNKLTVYRRGSGGQADPIRNIQGPHTELADPHGVYVDNTTNEIFVTNHGNYRETQTGEEEAHHGYPVPIGPSTGKFVPPAITIYPRTAEWDVKPTRVIQGAKTRMNLPQGITRDPASGQIIVANTGGNSILFFAPDAKGDAAPVRMLEGAATNIKAPSGVVIDTKHNELWVTNWENHMATVFPRTAQGNVAPIRYIRAATADASPASFGRPGTVAWDPNRKQILIAN